MRILRLVVGPADWGECLIGRTLVRRWGFESFDRNGHPDIEYVQIQIPTQKGQIHGERGY